MGQSIQAVSPLDDWNLPAAHAAQMLWPVLAVMVPGSHSMAAVAPVAHADPAGHCVQSLCAVAPVVFRKEPESQSSAALAPSAQCAPAWQACKDALRTRNLSAYDLTDAVFELQSTHNACRRAGSVLEAASAARSALTQTVCCCDRAGRASYERDRARWACGTGRTSRAVALRRRASRPAI